MTTSPLPLYSPNNALILPKPLKGDQRVESMLTNISTINSCTKNAFALTSAIYLSLAIGAYGFFYNHNEQRLSRLDLGSPTIAISLDQFTKSTPILNKSTKTNEKSDLTPPKEEPPLPNHQDITTKSQVNPTEHKAQSLDGNYKQAPLIKERTPSHQHRARHKKQHQNKHIVKQEMVNSASTSSLQAKSMSATTKAQRSEQVLILGRDSHPVLAKIKQEIDSNLLYPRRARLLKEQGAAIVQFTYTRQGQIQRLRLLRSSGSYELDEAAKQTIIRSSASFPKVNQDFTLRLPIIFRLTD